MTRLLRLHTPRPTTPRDRLGLQGPRKGWEEMGRKREGKEEREGLKGRRAMGGKFGKGPRG